MSNLVAKVEELIKFIDTGADDSKSDACMNAGPAKTSNQYQPKGPTQTLKPKKGSQTTRSDIQVYYSSEIDPSANIKNAVVLIYDIFGWNSKNKNVFELCDQIAARGNNQYYAVMPDFYRGNPWPVGKEIKMDEIHAWINKVATYEMAFDDMRERIVPSLRANGIENIAIVGLCWGGNIGFKFGENLYEWIRRMYVGLVSIHGSRITDELCQKMKVPVCYCATPKDYGVQSAKAILDSKSFGGQCVYKSYDNMGHGFSAGRGDYRNEENKAAVDDVLGLATVFFKNVFGVKDSGDMKVGGMKAADSQELTEAANAVRGEVQKMGDEKFECYEVVRGSKQVVAGMNYEIRVKVGTNRFADMKVYRSLPPFKYELKSVGFVTTEQPKLGGWGKAADSDEMNAAANAVKSEIEKQASDTGRPIKMFEVIEGRKQVVAGMNYKIRIKVDSDRFCEVKVYRSLPPVSYELKSVIWIEPPRPKRVGGFSDSDKAELTEAANAVRKEVEKAARDLKIECYEVVSGTKQVVAGMNYDIRMSLGNKRFAQVKVYRSLPPFKYELKEVSFSATV